MSTSDSNDLPRLRDFWMNTGRNFIVSREIIRYDEVDGFIYDDWAGVITFMIRGEECEITSLDSLYEDKGSARRLSMKFYKKQKK